MLLELDIRYIYMTQYITYLIKILSHKGFFVKFIKPNLNFQYPGDMVINNLQ